MCSRSECSSGTSSGGAWNTANHFGVAHTTILSAALPEFGATTTCIVVGRAWAKALFLLVVAGEKDLDDGGDEEESTIFS